LREKSDCPDVKQLKNMYNMDADTLAPAYPVNMEEAPMNRQTALIMGDTALAHWHFMNAAKPHLRETLEDAFDLTFSDDYPNITTDILKSYDLVINYTDNWTERGTTAAGVALMTFVATGGQLLSIHSGIIQPAPYFLLQMHGGKFTGHAAYATLNYRRTDITHPVTEGIESFFMGEEPYEFLLDPLAEKQLVLEYEYNGKIYPAAWVMTYGFGRIVYLSPGHDARSFAEPSFRKLIRNSALWLSPVQKGE
jgi:type 1 glutamine amidotransferase